ncbi:MAG: hypothetical protein QOI04_879 [Verrucomicrobiota bacterium]|jgi:exosortase
MNSRRLTFPWLVLFIFGLWFWAIWSCAEHWAGNPNYSYGWIVPFLALGFGIRRALAIPLHVDLANFPFSPLNIGLLVLISGALVFALEFARVQMWHPEIVLCAICFLAVAFSLFAFRILGGAPLLRAELFPVLFFLSAVPWPPRFEQPITSALMQWVAGATVELLHWFGIEAQTSGAAIALRSGLVGITEACSGVRSLQAGIMFGLAMGEWFLLRPWRRVALLIFAIVFALATNLVRTFTLSIQAERHGADSVERVHDLVGNIIITALIVGIWLAGKILSRAQISPTPFSIPAMREKLRALWNMSIQVSRPAFRAIFLATLAGFICARTFCALIDINDRTQTAPFFSARGESSGNHFSKIPGDIWQELHPTSGEYFQHAGADLPRGVADCYHFFWKPSPWNRFALVHRPDICMPGVGWKQAAPPEPIEVDFYGHVVRCYLFEFRRENSYALEVWGVWRNGEPLSLDYDAAQVFGAAPASASQHFEGKRRSATEIVACSLIGEGAAPSREFAVAVLRSAFDYNPR